MTASHTQQSRLLEWLRNPFKGHVTRAEAASELGIFELAFRIGELEARGFRVRRERVEVQNRWLETCHVTRYSLEFDPERAPAEAQGTLFGEAAR